MKEIDCKAVAIITVTYNPELDPLRAQLEHLPAESLKIIVDNASQPEVLQNITALVSRMPTTRMLRNAKNLGLAAAVNLGVRAVREQAPQVRWVLLLDQDSEPHAGSIQNLVDSFNALELNGERVGCIGPLLLDAGTGLSYGFHQATRWRWRRAYPPVGSTRPVACANINGSGSLVPIDLFLQLGGLDESLFIDHIDTEWSFRVLAAGYGLWGIPSAVFTHRMGQTSVRFWMLGWHVWPSRTPQRHYFLFRNAVTLMRRPYVPPVWKSWAIVKLALTALVHGLFDPERRSQWHYMWQGVRAGLSMCSAPPPGKPA